MKKILAIMALFLVLATSVSAVSMTMISGKVTDQDNVKVVGADVTVTCNSNVKTTTSDANGEYFVFYLPSQCDAGNEVTVSVTYDDVASGSNTGKVALDRTCRINTSVIDVQIPEFGVIATGVAMIGAIAGLVVLRKRN